MGWYRMVRSIMYQNLYNIWSESSKFLQEWKLFWYITTLLLLYGKILTTPTFLLLEYGFLAYQHLEAKKKNTKIGVI